MAWWLRLCAPNAGGPRSILGQGTRSHVLQLEIPGAATERPRMPQLNLAHTNNKQIFKKTKTKKTPLLAECVLPAEAMWESVHSVKRATHSARQTDIAPLPQRNTLLACQINESHFFFYTENSRIQRNTANGNQKPSRIRITPINQLMNFSLAVPCLSVTSSSLQYKRQQWNDLFQLYSS